MFFIYIFNFDGVIMFLLCNLEYNKYIFIGIKVIVKLCDCVFFVEVKKKLLNVIIIYVCEKIMCF